MDQREEECLRQEIGVIFAIEYKLRSENDKARLNALEAEILRRHPEYKGTSFTLPKVIFVINYNDCLGNLFQPQVPNPLQIHQMRGFHSSSSTFLWPTGSS